MEYRRQVSENPCRVQDYVIVVGGRKGVAAEDAVLAECLELRIQMILFLKGSVGHGTFAPVFENPDIGVDALLEYILERHVDIGRGGIVPEDVVSSCILVEPDHVARTARNVPRGSVLAFGQQGGAVGVSAAVFYVLCYLVLDIIVLGFRF